MSIHLIEKLKSKLNGKFSSLTINFNDDHSPNYNTAEEWYNSGNYQGNDKDYIDWVSDRERQKAIMENSVWTVHWYPDTPIGFYCVGASTLEAALEYALSYYEKK
jgi:hypothetical protein